VRDTFGGLRIQAGVDVVEKWKGEMLDIQEREIKRTYVEYGASEVGFRIALQEMPAFSRSFTRCWSANSWG